MPREFEIELNEEIQATPEEVWAAIATGPGIDSWFMGRTELEPREGGSGSWAMGGQVQHSTVTAWEPGKRLAYRGDPDPDGSFMAFEYLLEGRDGGSTVVRIVHSGMLGDDSWDAEYDAISKGDAMYFGKLVQYVEHFQGRTARHSNLLFGPQVADTGRSWDEFHATLGVKAPAEVGTPARLDVAGLPPVEGVIGYSVEPVALILRGDDWLVTLLNGYQNTVVAEYHAFRDIDATAVDAAWQSWLTRTFG
jgi:uncharacterized protein YndB with AHSA1/START domain